MQHRSLVSGRRSRSVAIGAAVVLASLVVTANPAGAHEYGHPSAPVAGTPVPNVGATVNVSPTTLAFPTERAGTFSGIPKIVTVTNTGSVAVVISDIASTTDYVGTTTCFAHASLAVGASCTITIYFFPNAFGTRSDTLQIKDNAAGSPQKVSMSGQGSEGYSSPGHTARSRTSVTRCFTATPAPSA
jgi:hypothetical protein